MAVVNLEEIENRIAYSYELPNHVLTAVPKPVVTIYTITYQHDPFIRECIDGVLAQKTSFPFEFIIGEDFSTDGTREIVFEYAKKYPDIIRVITADSNVGIKANARRCTRASRGKYLAPCEGDDYWTDPLKLQKQVDFLERNPDYSMCFHDCMILNQTTGTMRVRTGDRAIDENVDLESLILEKNIPTASMVFRNIGFHYTDEMLPLIQGDFLLCVLLAEQGTLKFLRENMSVYRRHDGGIWSGAGLERRLMEDLRFYDFLIARYRASRPELLPAIYSKIRFTQYRKALQLLRSGQRSKSLRCYAGVLFSRYRMKRLKHREYLKEWLKSFPLLKAVFARTG